MENQHIDTGHEKRLTSLICEDGMKYRDMERLSLFYIIAGNESLYRRRNSIYDFKGRCIKTCIRDGREDFSSGQWALIKLGFNLYNGYSEEQMTPMDLFWSLDHKNIQIAHDAIGLRFNNNAPSIPGRFVK